MAPPLPPDLKYRDHPVALKLRLMGIVRLGFILGTIIVAGVLVM